MNITILCGRLVRDPEVRYSQGDKPTAIAKYTLAVDRSFKQDGQPTADFITCVAMGRNGEFAEKYLKQGTKIIVIGEWRTGSYTNKDGNKVYTNECMVSRHEFAESKSNNTTQEKPATGSGDNFMSIPDNIGDELPFH